MRQMKSGRLFVSTWIFGLSTVCSSSLLQCQSISCGTLIPFAAETKDFPLNLPHIRLPPFTTWLQNLLVCILKEPSPSLSELQQILSLIILIFNS